MKIENNLLTIKQAAEILNLKESRLRYEVFLHRIPFIKIGRSIRFEVEALNNWIQNKRVEVKNG